MNAKFKEMLAEAEKIRAACRHTGDIGLHAEHMQKMTKYGVEKKLLTDSKSEEYLSQTAEMAACILEINYGEKIGSILDSSPERKHNIIESADKKAKARFKSVIECGC